MDINSLIPSVFTIPQDFLVFRILAVLTFFIHFLFVNLLIGSSLISLFINIRNRFSKESYQIETAKDLAGKLPFILAFTVNLGVAPYLFLQVILGSYIYTSSIIMAVYWLSVIISIMVAYGSLYFYKSKFDSFSNRKKLLISSVFCSLLIYTAFIFSGNVNLMLEPDKWVVFFKNPHGTFYDLLNPLLFVKMFHIVNGSIAVTGLFIALLWFLKSKGSDDFKEKTNFGLKIFKYTTLIQIASGIVLYYSIPEFVLKNLTLNFYNILSVGFITTIVSLLFIYKKRLITGSVFLAITFFLMILLKDLIRFGYLEMYVDVGKYTVQKQNAPFLIFITILLFCTVFMIFITRKVLKEKN